MPGSLVYSKSVIECLLHCLLNIRSTRGDCNMICWFKQEECSHLMAACLVYSKSVIECLLHCLLNIRRNIGDAFFYVITCVYTSWKTVVLLFLFHVLDCNAIFANQDLLPTLRPGNFDLHTKMPGSAPAQAVVHKCPVCADFLLVGRRSDRLCRRLVLIWYLQLHCLHISRLTGTWRVHLTELSLCSLLRNS